MKQQNDTWSPGKLALASLTALICLGVSTGGSPLAQSTPPNILLVVLDDVGVDKLGVYGEAGACSGNQAQCFADTDCPAGQTCNSDYAITPHIDQLATEGILFRNFWTAPTCTPTRGTLLTGRYGFRTGILEVGDTLPGTEMTIPEVLDDGVLGSPSGFTHALIGKWHLQGGDLGPNNNGFSHFAGGLGGGVGNYFNWSRTVDGVTNNCSPGSAACPVDAYSTTVNVDDALAWIGMQTDPWFVSLNFNAPHAPFHVPVHSLLSATTLARLPQQGGNPAPEGTTCTGANRAICYQAAIEAADTEFGRLRLALTEPTTIILIGDNGTPRGVTQAPFDSNRAKGAIYEGGINTPLIIRHASGIPANTETAALAHSVDLFATVLELAGAALPADRAIDSISLVPVINDPTATVRGTVYAERTDPQATREERFKLIRQASFDELYDLEGDPPAPAPDPFEINDLLLGTCSSSTSQTCHDDGDCPGAEVCDVFLAPVQQEAFDSLVFEHDFLMASCEPLACTGAITCATGVFDLTLSGAGPVVLDWSDITGAAGYDVLRGDASTLRATGGDYTTATDTCLEDDLGPSTTTDGTVPALGQAHWYLVRPAGSPCDGSYGDGSERPGLRDYLIASSVATCS